MINKVTHAMLNYEAGCPKRGQHLIKVHAFSKLIGVGEGLNPEQLYLLELTALVHDIGIKIVKDKKETCLPSEQEAEGAKAATELLTQFGVDPEVVEAVSYIVGHHHTYTDINSIEYQILVEADFIVNSFEGEKTQEQMTAVLHHIFKTQTGKELYATMFGL